MCPQVNGMKECYAGAQDTEFRSFYGSAAVDDFGAALHLTLLSESRIKSATSPHLRHKISDIGPGDCTWLI
jgi:hypothetical protein